MICGSVLCLRFASEATVDCTGSGVPGVGCFFLPNRGCVGVNTLSESAIIQAAHSLVRWYDIGKKFG